MSAQTETVLDPGLEIGDDVPDEDGAIVDDPGAAQPDPDAKPKEGAADLSALTEDQIKALPPDAQAVVRNLQADYTRKTQSLAEQRKALDNQTAYASLAQEVQQVMDEDGPAAAADYLREAANQIAGDTRTAGDRPTDQAAGQTPDAVLQQVAQAAYEISTSPDAAPNEQALARGMMTLLQVNAALAQEVTQTKQSAESGLRQFANNEIRTTLSTLHEGNYKALEPDVSSFAKTVLQTARQEGITNLQSAAKLAYADKAIEQARTQSARREALKEGLPDADVGAGAPPNTQGPAKTVEEGFRRVMQRRKAQR